MPDQNQLREDLLSPGEIESQYGINSTTQAVWRSTNRYGWRDLSIKVGRLVRMRRSVLEKWLDSRTGLCPDNQATATTPSEPCGTSGSNAIAPYQLGRSRQAEA